MASEQYLLIALLVIAAAFLLRRLRVAASAWKYHGLMLVRCPENNKPAAVKVGTFRAALRGSVNHGQLELCSCSRWPEHRDCDQDCVRELEYAPADHRVWTIASKWFVGKNCIYCRRPIGRVSHLDHAPALMKMVDRKTVEWRDLRVEYCPKLFLNPRQYAGAVI